VVVVVVVMWRIGGYVGLWPWLRASVFSGWTKLRDRVTFDPRFDVLLPTPVRRVLHWIFRLDSKVTTTCSSFSGSCSSSLGVVVVCSKFLFLPLNFVFILHIYLKIADEKKIC